MSAEYRSDAAIAELISENAPIIQVALEEELKKVLNDPQSYGLLFSEFDLKTRKLSEMRLCAACHDLKKIMWDCGFEIQFGTVHFGWMQRRGHLFFLSPENEIVCFTPGQFVWHNDGGIKKGERIARLQKKAPGLVHTVNNEVALLHGGREEIYEQTGLKYNFFRE